MVLLCVTEGGRKERKEWNGGREEEERRNPLPYLKDGVLVMLVELVFLLAVWMHEKVVESQPYLPLCLGEF